MRKLTPLLTAWTLSTAVALCAQTANPEPADPTYSVAAAQTWTDTGLELQGGERIEITATVQVPTVPDRHALAGASSCDPHGVPAGEKEVSGMPLPSALPGAVLAKLHESDAPIVVGAAKEIEITGPAHLFLGANVGQEPVCQGVYKVTVHRTAAPKAVAAPGPSAEGPNMAATSTAVKTEAVAEQKPATPAAADKAEPAQKSRGEQLKSQLANAAQIFMEGQFGVRKPTGSAAEGATTNANAGEAAKPAAPTFKVSDSQLDSGLRKLIDNLPRRVNDQFQNLGDMVNFVIIGSEKDVQAALEAGDWHVADTDKSKAVISAVLHTYEQKDYLQMPMSTLYLFGRPQDFGYEQAEPIAMVASRHHFRIWKAPFTWKGKEVWVGAGTHDVGFAKDRRNGSVTHKIDPAVDGERDNIGNSLEKSGKVKSFNYYLPPNPVQEARNATGDGYHSDGRLLVISLQ